MVEFVTARGPLASAMPTCSACFVHLATEAEVVAHIVKAGRIRAGRPRHVRCGDALVLPDAGEAAGAGGGLGMAGEEDDGLDTQVCMHGCAPAHRLSGCTGLLGR